MKTPQKWLEEFSFAIECPVIKGRSGLKTVLLSYFTAIQDDALRTAPTISVETRSIDHDLAGQTLESICRQNNTILMGVPMAAHSLAHPPSYTLIATKFAVQIASSLREKKGKCVWMFFRDAKFYKASCKKSFPSPYELTKGAGFKFCPFCGLEIEESKA